MPSYKRSSAVEPYNKRHRTTYSNGRDSGHVEKWTKHHKFEPIKVPKQSDPNYILRVVVWNPAYEVTTETLHYLFSQYGNVLRIVLFTKNGLPNGMIEMDSIESKFVVNCS
jgi:RNA recognition motif-containing protein